MKHLAVSDDALSDRNSILDGRSESRNTPVRYSRRRSGQNRDIVVKKPGLSVDLLAAPPNTTTQHTQTTNLLGLPHLIFRMTGFQNGVLRQKPPWPHLVTDDGLE